MADKQIVMHLPDYHDAAHYAPGTDVRLDVEGVTDAGLDAVRVTGRAVLSGRAPMSPPNGRAADLDMDSSMVETSGGQPADQPRRGLRDRPGLSRMTGTSVADLWWPMWHRGGRLEELDAGECRRLLAGTAFGRLGYQTERGPRIVPMNYALVGDSIVTRTAPDPEMARFAVKQTVAFEIDQADEYLQRGWSVLVVGELRMVSAEAVRMLTPGQTPDPWPEGPRSIFLQLGINELTGRRVHPPQ